MPLRVLFLLICAVAAWSAPWRHHRMHSPQSMQRSGSAWAHPSRTRMAPVGQALQQATHPTQRPLSKTMERRPVAGLPGGSGEADGIGEGRPDPGARLDAELVEPCARSPTRARPDRDDLADGDDDGEADLRNSSRLAARAR